MNLYQFCLCGIVTAKGNKVMADKNLKHPENVPGRFYVDDSCIDCDMCRTTAPSFLNVRTKTVILMFTANPKHLKKLPRQKRREMVVQRTR